MKYNHLTKEEKTQIIDEYSTQLKTMKELAIKYHVTRQAIFKTLTKAGVNTHKGPGGATQVTFTCSVCGNPVSIIRARFRKSKNVFCSQKCYTAWLQHGNGNPLLIHRQSARISRAKIAKVFPLQPEHIVHHEDRSQFNTDLNNLKVFANQGDHIRYHRGIEVPILWP